MLCSEQDDTQDSINPRGKHRLILGLLRMTYFTPNFKLSIQVRKEGLAIKNSVHRSTSPLSAETSIYQIARLPEHLAPIVDKVLSLPLRAYDLELQGILSMAIIGRPNQATKYISPLDPRVHINHYEPIFQTTEFTCCKYDEQTVVTFLEEDDNLIHQGGIRYKY